MSEESSKRACWLPCIVLVAACAQAAPTLPELRDEGGAAHAGAGSVPAAGAFAGAAPASGGGGLGSSGAGGARAPIVPSSSAGAGGAPAPLDSTAEAGTPGTTGGVSGAAGASGGGAGAPADRPVAGGDPTAATLTANGPYTVQSYLDGFAIGPDFPGGTVWYPSDGEPPFASIVIVPGFVSPRALIEAWGPFLASHGIVTFTIDTNAVTDQPAARSRALLNGLESLRAENTRASSPLSGKLDVARQAVGGWSMGGGGTLITAEGHPELKAAIAMCSWSPGGRFSQNSVPTLLFASAGDPLAGGQSQGFYESIPDSTPKILFEWGLGDHFLANAPTGASSQVGALALAWLKVFLEGDQRYRPFIDVTCDGCTDFRKSL